jgi:hypothetical protein
MIRNVVLVKLAAGYDAAKVARSRRVSGLSIVLAR